MSVTIKPSRLKYKDPITGNYVSVDAIGTPLTEVIAPAYEDLTFPVVEGELCIHNGKLQSANQAISTSESWTAAHWDEVFVSSELKGKVNKDDFYATEIPVSSSDSTKVSTELSLLNGALSNKISEPQTEGTSGQFLQTDGNGGRTWATPSGGDPTSIIDDTAGAGDTNKVWSADKSASENTLLSGAIYDLIKRTTSSISCTFTQGSATIYNTDTLDSLKQYLVVTATYVNSSTETIDPDDYTLSGILSPGTATITASYAGKTNTFTVTVTQNVSVVDVCLFAGQSNMDGRGDSSEAPTVTQGTAFKWDNTNNTIVDFVVEGSMIPAFLKEYYDETGRVIVEVKEAEGGINISQWMSNHMSQAVTKISNCVSYLEDQGKTVRNVFMVWNQGENDVYDETTTAQYETLFGQMKTTVMAGGIEKIFIVNIGQVSVGNYDFTDIRTALANVCNNTDVVMVSDKFRNATEYMKDQWHYNQIVYNVVGKNAAYNIASYFSNGVVPAIVQFNAADVWGVPSTYGTLNDWSYELHCTKALLKSYTGAGGAVRVYHMYKVGDMYYEGRIVHPRGSGYDSEGTFYQNATITELTIDENVKYINPNNYSDEAVQQSAYGVFREMAECTSITGIPASNSQENAFRGSTKLATISPLSSVSTARIVNAFRQVAVASFGDFTDVTNCNDAFRGNTALKTVGSISGTYSSLQNMFNGCTSLEEVGTFDSTAITRIDSMFLNCTALEGTVKFMSSSISNASNAFYGCDLTKIEIQVPANSTSYTTITTAYPSANVTTF